VQKEMSRAECRNFIEEALEVEPGSLAGTEELDGLKAWSSLTVMVLIAAADEKLGVVLAPRDLAACRTIDDLAVCLQTHVKALG
jgi:acyl carrier protein